MVLCVPKKKLAVKIERVFHPLAAFSYTLYLTHRITLLLVFRFAFDKYSHTLTATGIALYAGVVGFCLFMGWVVYYFTERNTGKVKRWMKEKIMVK